MDPRTPRGRAVLLLGLCGGALADWAVFAPKDGGYPGGAITGWVVTVLVVVPQSLLTAFLLWRVPGHGIGRVLTVMTLATGLGLVVSAVNGGGTSPGGHWDLLATLAGVSWVGTLPLLPVLILLFPSGRPSSSWWRGVLIAELSTIGVLTGVVVSGAALSGPVHVIAVAGGVLLVLGGALAAGALVGRWRRSTGTERAQLRLFTLAAAAIVGWYVVTGLLLAVGVGVGPWADAVSFVVISTALPLTMGYAVLRHQLYGIEPVVNRFVVWTLVSVMIVTAYLALSALLSILTGATGRSPLGAAVVALSVALLLAPVRRHAQRLVDRAMYGDRGDPLQVLRTVAARLAAAVERDEVGRELTRTVTGSLRLSWAALELESEGTWTRVAEEGATMGVPPTTFAMQDGGADVGRLLVAPRRGERDLGPRDRRLLADLVVQAGPAIRASRLVAELTESRERLVAARESERRRLRRDLHDCLSPALSGIGLSADTASRLLPVTPGDARPLLARIARQARDSTAVIGRMLADLRPPELAEVGLIAALTERAVELARPGEFAVRVKSTAEWEALDPGLELVAYRVTVEAMANAARHSGGTVCDVMLDRPDHWLRIVVTDDGRGLTPNGSPGIGLTSMKERVEEAGGRLALTANGPGVTVTAQLPVSAAPA